MSYLSATECLLGASAWPVGGLWGHKVRPIELELILAGCADLRELSRENQPVGATRVGCEFPRLDVLGNCADRLQQPRVHFYGAIVMQYELVTQELRDRRERNDDASSDPDAAKLPTLDRVAHRLGGSSQGYRRPP